MVKVNFNTSDFKRQVADAPALMLKNRYFEQNPALTEDGASLLARPGLRRFVDVGAGPIRGLFSEPGTFNGDLFAASYDSLYRVSTAGVSTLVSSGLASPDFGIVNMAITGNIGDVPEFLFFCDGQALYVYVEGGYANGTITGTPANTDVIRMDNTYYQFTSGSVDAGTPAGTAGNPWLVALGGAALISWQNFFAAIGAAGVAGTTYSTALTAHPTIDGVTVETTGVQVRANFLGAGGNALVTTETGAAIAWGAATLTGGGSPTVFQVQMPDDVGVIDVAVVNSFVIVVPAQGAGINGRFYWIEPGEIVVDPLNFATAERSPDPISGVEVVGDQFWLPGESTTEVWYVTDDPTNRMRRLQGVVFDRGTWENTAVAIHENLIITDADGGVFLIKGGQPQRISTPDIEEQIRTAIGLQSLLTS